MLNLDVAGQIKYRFSKDLNGNLVDVNSLVRTELTKGAKFLSLDFEQELIPALGKSRRKHFKHKPGHDVLGSRETYLHALGKKVFRLHYELCILKKQPFYLKFHRPKVCIGLREKYGITCNVETDHELYDLTQTFTEITEEKKDGVFVPDLMLYNPSKGDKIYIEIAVSHDSTESKVRSRTRIIEYKLYDEDDIQLIVDSKNGISEIHARLFNFRKTTREENFCQSQCTHSIFYYFVVAKSGKAKLMKELSIANIEEQRKDNAYYLLWDAVEPEDSFDGRRYDGLDHPEVFRYFVALAHKKGVKIKNCFLCKYRAENNSRYFVQEEAPIFCKFLKKQCGSNTAADCEYYRVNNEYVTAYIRRAQAVRENT